MLSKVLSTDGEFEMRVGLMGVGALTVSDPSGARRRAHPIQKRYLLGVNDALVGAGAQLHPHDAKCQKVYREFARAVYLHPPGGLVWKTILTTPPAAWVAQLLVDSVPEPEVHGPLVFKDPASAFDYACQYLNCVFPEHSLAPCIVRSLTKTPLSGWLAQVSIPSAAGGENVLAALPGEGPYPGIVGKLCAVSLGPEVAREGQSVRAGLLEAVLEPSLNGGSWVISRSL